VATTPYHYLSIEGDTETTNANVVPTNNHSTTDNHSDDSLLFEEPPISVEPLDILLPIASPLISHDDIKTSILSKSPSPPLALSPPLVHPSPIRSQQIEISNMTEISGSHNPSTDSILTTSSKNPIVTTVQTPTPPTPPTSNPDTSIEDLKKPGPSTPVHSSSLPQVRKMPSVSQVEGTPIKDQHTTTTSSSSSSSSSVSTTTLTPGTSQTVEALHKKKKELEARLASIHGTKTTTTSTSSESKLTPQRLEELRAKLLQREATQTQNSSN
jgi:hypothetical protein